MSTINYFSVSMGNGEKRGLTWTAVHNLINNLRLPHPDSELAVQIRKEIPMSKHLYQRFYEKPWLYYQIIQSYALYTAGNHSVCSVGVKHKKIPFEVRMRMDPQDAWPKLQPPTPQQWFDKERTGALMSIIDLSKENALQREGLKMADQLKGLFDLATRKYREQLALAGSLVGDASRELAKYCSRVQHKSHERRNITALLLCHKRRIIEEHAINPMAALMEYHGNNKTIAVRVAKVFRQQVKRLEEVENELNFLLASDEMVDKKHLRTQLALAMRQVIQLRRANSDLEENRYDLELELQQLKTRNQQQRSSIKNLETKAINTDRWRRWTREEANRAQAGLGTPMEVVHSRKVLELGRVSMQPKSMCHEVERKNDLLITEGGTNDETDALKIKLQAYRLDNKKLMKERDEAREDADTQANKTEIARRQNVNFEKNADNHKKKIEKLYKQNADLMRALQQCQTAKIRLHRDQPDRNSQLIIFPSHNEGPDSQSGSNDRPQSPTTPSSTSSASSTSTEKTFYYDDSIDTLVERAVVTANHSLSELKTDEIESLGYKFNVLRYWKKAHEDENKRLRISQKEELFAKQSEINSLQAQIRALKTSSSPSSTNSAKTFDLNRISEKAVITADVFLHNFEIRTLGEKYKELRAWKKVHKDRNNKLRQWHQEELVAKQGEIDLLLAKVRELESRPSFPVEQIKKLAAAGAISNENAILRLSLADEKAQRTVAEESLDALAESLEAQLQAKDDYYGAPGCFQDKRCLETRYNNLAASRIELWDDNDALRLTLRELDPDTGLAGLALSKVGQLYYHLHPKLSDEDFEKVKDLNDTLAKLTDGLRLKLRSLDLGSKMPGGLGSKLQDYDQTFKLPNGLSKQGWLLHRVHIELLMSNIGKLEGTVDDLRHEAQGKDASTDLISDRLEALGMENCGQRWQEFEEVTRRLANTEEVVTKMKTILAQQMKALAEAEARVWAMQDLQARIDELEEELASHHLNSGNTDNDGVELPRGRSPTPMSCINGLWGGFGGNALELLETVRCLGNELADVNTRLGEMRAEKSIFKSDVAQREWWIGQLQEEAVQREKHISELRDADFEKKAHEFAMRIAKLEYRNAELEDERRSHHLNDNGDLTELQHTVSRQNSELTQAYLRLDEADATASRLRGIIELRDNFIRKAEIEHEEELESLQETISDQRRDLAHAYSSADGLKTIISDFRETVSQRDVDNNELKATNSGLRQAIADLKDEIQKLHMRIQSVKQESKDMEDLFFNAQSARDILDVENYRIQKLKEEVARLEKEKAGIENENKEVIELCNGRTRDLNVAMDKYNKAKIMLHCTTKEVETLKSKLKGAECAPAEGEEQNIFFREEHRRTSMLSATRRVSNHMASGPHTLSIHPRADAQRNGSPGPRSEGLVDSKVSMSSMIAHFMPPSSPASRIFQPSSPRASSPPARPLMRARPSYAKSAALNSSLSRHAGQVLRSHLNTVRSSHLPLLECSPSEAERRLKAMHGTELMEAASLVEEPPVFISPLHQIQRDHTAEVARIKALMTCSPVAESVNLQKEPYLQTELPAAKTSSSVSEGEVVTATEEIWERPVSVEGKAHNHTAASIDTCTLLPYSKLQKDEEAAKLEPVVPKTVGINAENIVKMRKSGSSLSLLAPNRISKRLSRGIIKATATASITMDNIAGFVGSAMTKPKSKTEIKESSRESGASFEVSVQLASRRGIDIARKSSVNVSVAAITSRAPSRIASISTKTPNVIESGIEKSYIDQKGARLLGDQPRGLSMQPSSKKLRKVRSGLPVPTPWPQTETPKTPSVVQSVTAEASIYEAAQTSRKPAPLLLQDVPRGLPLRCAPGAASPALVKTVVSVTSVDDQYDSVSVSSLAAAPLATAPLVNADFLKIENFGNMKAGQTSALSLVEAASKAEARIGLGKVVIIGDLRSRQTSASAVLECSKLRTFPSMSNIRENPFMKADPKRVSSASSGSPLITEGNRTASGETQKKVTSGGSVKDRAAVFMGSGKENSPSFSSPFIDSHGAASETTNVGKLNTASEFADKLQAIHTRKLSFSGSYSTVDAHKSPLVVSNGEEPVSQATGTSLGNLKPNSRIEDKSRAIYAPTMSSLSSIHISKSSVDSLSAPKLSTSNLVDALKSPQTSPIAQGSELNIQKLRLKKSTSRLPLAISGNRSISAALKSAPLKPSPLANSFRFPSDTCLVRLSAKQSSELKHTRGPTGSSLGGFGPTTLEGNPVRQKLSAEGTNKTLSDTSNEITTTPSQPRAVPRKPSRLPLKLSMISNSDHKATGFEYTSIRSSTPTARPATPRQLTPTAAATPNGRRPTPQHESSMPTQLRPGTKQHQEALFGQIFAPTSDAAAPSFRSSVYSEVMPSSPPIMAHYDGWEASSDYDKEADVNPSASNHHPVKPTYHNTVAISGLRPYQAAGSTNSHGASAGSLRASSSSAAVPGQPLSSDGIAPRHPVINPSGLRRPISIGAAAVLYSAAASSSPRPPALPGRDLDSLPSQRNRSAPPLVELARRPAVADRSTSQRGPPLPSQPQREHKPLKNSRTGARTEEPFIPQGNKDRTRSAQARLVENPFGRQDNTPMHQRGCLPVDNELESYVSNGQKVLPPPKEYREFEGNPFVTPEVKSKVKGNAVATNQSDYPVCPSSPPRAQLQLGQMPNNQFIHRQFSGLPQNLNSFTGHRGPVINGVQYPPWDEVKGALNDNPFTNKSPLATRVSPAVAPAVAPPNPLCRQPSQHEGPQYGLPITPRPVKADPFDDCCGLAPAIAPPRREETSREMSHYILPKTRRGLQNQYYEPLNVLVPDRPANKDQEPHLHCPVSDADPLFDFLLEDVRQPSSSTPAPMPQTPVPCHPIQHPPPYLPASQPKTPKPCGEIKQQPSSQDRFGQRFGERFEQFDRTFNDDDIPNNMPKWDEANMWAVPDSHVRIEGPDPRRLKEQQSTEQKERGWKRIFSRNEGPAPNQTSMAVGGPSSGSRLASIGQGLRDFGRSTSNVFRRGHRHEHSTTAIPPTNPTSRWGRQLIADLNASARRLFGRVDPPLSRPLAETRNPPSHGLTGGEHGMRGRRSSARSLHTRGSRVFSPVNFDSSPPRLDSDPPHRQPCAHGLQGSAEWNLRRRNSAFGREEHESDWVDESGIGYDEDEISIEYNFGDRWWAIKEGRKRGRRFSQ